MSYRRWTRTPRRTRPSPKCIFCDTATEPAVIFRGEEHMLRGWRCPKCGFTIIHPTDVQRALEILRATAEAWKR